MAATLTIRHLEPRDRAQWTVLWNDNTDHAKNEAATHATWKNLTADDVPLFGLCAEANGILCGILHYALHPLTGFVRPACYMQDLYVAPESRRQGVAQKLLAHLRAEGEKEEWIWIHWFVDEGNKPAAKLYQQMGTRTALALHVMALQG